MKIPSNIKHLILLSISAWLSCVTQASIVGPYATDTSTLHLWHLDETAVPCIDSGNNPVNLAGLLNSATLGNSSYSGFGNCLNTLGAYGLAAWSENPAAATTADTGAGLFPTTTATAATTITYQGANGAFTFEALICPLFPVNTNFGTVAHGGIGRTVNNWQLVTGESGVNADRIWQWRFDPIGTYTSAPEPSTGNTSPLLDFINVNSATTVYEVVANIPTNGPNAIASNQWFHIAVTYSGQPNTPGNFNFYWTAMNATNTAANLILSTNLVASLPANEKPSFAIGNTGRNDEGNWLGEIDEVRMSSVARSPIQMMFTSVALNWVTVPQSQEVLAGSTVTLTSLAGGTSPAYQWQFNSTNIPGATNANLVISNIATTQTGTYSVVATNSTSALPSQSAVVTVAYEFTDLFNTGVDNSGALLVGGAIDPHYQMTFSGDPNFPGPNAVVIGSPPSSYDANGPYSQWLAPVASGSAAGGVDFDYTTTFIIDTMNAANAVLNGAWGADNNGLDILLNGVSTGNSVVGFATLSPFTITNGQVHAGFDINGNPIMITNYFVQGLNTLTFITSNAPSGGDNPTAFRAELNGFATPLPPTAPEILIGPQNIITNSEQEAVFFAVASGSAPISYQWYFGSNALAGQTSQTLTLTDLSTNEAGTYTVVVSNAVSTASAGAILTVVTPTTLSWLGEDLVNSTYWDTVSTNWVADGSMDVVFSQMDNVVFTDQASNFTVNLQQALSPNSILEDATNTYELFSDFGGYLTGPVVLIKTNTGTLILDTPNTYTGPTLIEQGVVQVGNADNNGTLGSGPVINNASLVLNRSDEALDVANPISGPGSVTMAGTGGVALSGANTYTGGTTVASGILETLNVGALGLGLTTVLDGGELYIPEDINLGNVPLSLGGNGFNSQGALYHQGGGGGTIFGGPITLTDDTTIGVANIGTLNLTNSAGITGSNFNLTIQVNQGSPYTSVSTITGPISLGTGSLTVGGSGTVTLLSSNNSWTGGTTLNNSVLQIGTGAINAAIGSGPVSDSGILIFDNSLASYVIAPAITANGNVTFTGSSAYTVTNALSDNGSVSNTGSASLVLLGGINGNGTLIDTSSGVVTMVGNNSSFSGNITISGAGQLVATNTDALGSGNVMIGGAQADICSLVLADNTDVTNNISIYPRAFGTQNNPADVDSQSGSNVLCSPNPIIIPTGGNLLTFECDSGYLTVAASITSGGGGRDLVMKGAGSGQVLGNISSAGANSVFVWKLDTGTWTLWGANTPGTNTTISNGVLVINGSMDANTITVAGGTLSGTGTLAGPVVVNSGATISPGPGIGTLTINNTLTLNPGSATVLDISAAGVTNSAVAGATMISYGGTLTVTNLGGALAAGNSFTLFSSTGYTNSFSSLTLPPLSPGLAWSTGFLGVNGTITVAGLTQPSFSPVTLSGTNLIMSGTGGAPGVSFSLLTSTNLTVPLSSWTVLQKGYFNSTGGFSVTNGIAAGTPQSFYAIRSP